MTYSGVYLGDLHLTGVAAGGYKVELLAEGTDWGNPQPTEVAVQSLLQDGELVEHTRDGNREQPVRIVITGTAAQLEQGEKDLMAELYKRNTLTVPSLLAGGQTTVFDIVTSSLQQVPDDLAEVRANQWHYSVRLVSLPFGRSVDNVTITPTPTSIGTARQKSYSFSVAGSARSEAAVHVSGGVGGLGQILLYTRPGANGMIPLRQYRSGVGSVTVDSARVSGSYDVDLEDLFTAVVPKEEVPDGTYVVAALLRGSGDGDSSVEVQTYTAVGGDNVRASDSWSADVIGLTTAYQLYLLGPRFQIPGAVVGDESNATVGVVIGDENLGLTVRLDEAWLIEVGSGALTWLDGKVTLFGSPPAAHLWVDPPSVDRPYKRVMRGAASDQSDAFGAEVDSWGAHVLEPGVNTATLVTVDDTTSVLSLTYPPSWHTHAGTV